jgi:hypothetical protein
LKTGSFFVKAVSTKIQPERELPMPTIPQNDELLKHLFELLSAQREIADQQRVFERLELLVVSELFTFGRHTVTQLLMSLGLNEQDWSAWYRLFSEERFNYEAASAGLFEESLRYVAADEVYVAAGDATQTPRSSRKLEGAGWLRNLRTPPFMVGIHAAQRWFNGSWLIPQEQGYSRAVPLRWLPAFTEKSQPQTVEPLKEWQACVQFLQWLRVQFAAQGRPEQPILCVGDGHYDNLNLWQQLPEGVTLLARSAKNRVLYHLPDETMHGNRKYGERGPQPQAIWQDKHTRWRDVTLDVRGKTRHLQVCVRGPFVRKGAADTPLMLIVVRGKQRKNKQGRTYRRQPLPFLVNAVQDDTGQWLLPLPLETLLFWAWQRWELEVCHRELKTTFGLGHKQCFNPHAAILSVQWSAWVYSLLLLAGYRTFGLARAPNVPTRWWRGSGRWSFATLLRSFRAALWGQHHFRPIFTPTPHDWVGKRDDLLALKNSIYAAMRS